MRFDLVDLQLFIAVADGRGVELTVAGESLLDHARLVMHNVEAMRGDLARFASGVRASVQLLANTSGLAEHLPKALAAFLREHPDINVDVEERESTDIASAIATGAADLGFAAEHALPETIERFAFSEDRLTLVTARRGPFAGRRLIDFRELAASSFVGLTSETAQQLHIAKHAARLGMRLRFRCDLPDGGGRCRRCRGARGRRQTLRAVDAACDRPHPRRLGQPQARDLRPQLQGAAATGKASGRPSARGGVIQPTSMSRRLRP